MNASFSKKIELKKKKKEDEVYGYIEHVEILLRWERDLADCTVNIGTACVVPCCMSADDLFRRFRTRRRLETDEGR